MNSSPNVKLCHLVLPAVRQHLHSMAATHAYATVLGPCDPHVWANGACSGAAGPGATPQHCGGTGNAGACARMPAQAVLITTERRPRYGSDRKPVWRYVGPCCRDSMLPRCGCVPALVRELWHTL